MATPTTVTKKGGPVPRDHFIVNVETGCHDWIGARWGEYGCVKREGRRRLAHRFYYERQHGPIPDGLELDHLCRNRLCVNPDHLEPVTTAVNQQRGDAAKLNWHSVEYIRTNHVPRHPEFGMRALGRRFGVTHEAIRKVVNNTAWAVPMAS